MSAALFQPDPAPEHRAQRGARDGAGDGATSGWVGRLTVPAAGGDVSVALQPWSLGVAVAVEGAAVRLGSDDRFCPAWRVPLRRLEQGWVLAAHDAPPADDWPVVGVLELSVQAARFELERASPSEFGELPWVAWPRIYRKLVAPTRRLIRAFPLPLFDLTERVESGRLVAPVETERFVKIRASLEEGLLREYRAVLLTGAPGAGKSTLLRDLAHALVSGRMASRLQGLCLVGLDASAFDAARANTSELHLQTALAKLAEAPVIVFVDEAHRLAHRSGSTADALDLLKLLISEHGLRVVLCTNEAHRLLGKDAALDRRLTKVVLPEAGRRELREQILEAKAELAWRRRGVRVDSEAIDRIVGYSAIEGRHAQPHAGVQCLDRCVARAERLGSRHIDAQFVAQVAVEQLGHTTAGLDSALERVQAQVVGHRAAIETLLRLLLADERRKLSPRAQDVASPFSAVICGSYGVGKSTLVEAIHRLRSPEQTAPHFVVAGGDFQRSENVNRLVGAPPAYIGHGGSAEIVKVIQANPRAVIEFSEPELGCRALLDRVLMPILDGQLTSNEGDTLVTRGLCICITTNAGADDRRPLGFARAGESASTQSLESLRRVLPGPIWSRLGGTAIRLGRLSRDHLRQILTRLQGRLADREGITLIVDDEATDWLIDHSEGIEQIGVRALQTTFDQRVAAPIEHRLLECPDFGGFRIHVRDARVVVTALERDEP